MKKILLLLVYLLFVFISFGKEIKIVSKLILNITDFDKKSSGKIINLEYPARIVEGYNEEIMVLNDTFFEVFNNKGNYLKKVGNRGQGPGDFVAYIKDVIKYNSNYYFQDYPNKISVFDKKFVFVKSFFLGGGKTSPFLYSFDFDDKYIYAAQYYAKVYNKSYDSVVKYDEGGRIVSHFFDRKNIMEIYKLPLSLPEGLIKIMNGRIIFSISRYPVYWIFDKKGKLIRNKFFNFKWWRYPFYDKKEYEKEKKRIGERAFTKVLFSGTIATNFTLYGDNLIVHIIRNPYDNPQHGFIMIDKNLNLIMDWTQVKGYQYSGASKNYIYFSKVLRYYNKKNRKEVEVLRCVIK